MSNDTILKFGYPDTLVRPYDHWVVLVRRQQVTAGSLVIACWGEFTRLGAVPAAAFAELAVVTRDLEGALERAFRFDKINYLMLMMVDPHVHWHVIPRYASERVACDVTFVDTAWPRPPALDRSVTLSEEQVRRLVALLRSHWPAAAT
jgi:diadenosine tetraphosphate (Ap4A) HIT family hydrolase